MIEKNRANLAKMLFVAMESIDERIKLLRNKVKETKDKDDAEKVISYLEHKVSCIYDVQDCLEKEFSYEEMIKILEAP